MVQDQEESYDQVEASAVKGVKPGMTEDSLETVRPYLLPNEDVEFVCRIQSGFIVLSSRRFVLLKEKKNDTYIIEKAIPYSCISSIEQKKKDRFEISCVVLDQSGQHTQEIKPIKVNAASQSEMNQCVKIVEEKRNFAENTTTQYDYSYLEHMPVSLTRNAILDLNTILRDQPIYNELVHEAEEFLGSEPFILEESLRAGDDEENGILLAAGTRGYFWIRGRKNGRFMSNVIVDTIEWSNLRSISYRWDSENAIISVNYSLTSDGKEQIAEYQWKPTTNDETLRYPWFLQPNNGPWILTDIIRKYSKITIQIH